jgi:hypothetical protein
MVREGEKVKRGVVIDLWEIREEHRTPPSLGVTIAGVYVNPRTTFFSFLFLIETP